MMGSSTAVSTAAAVAVLMLEAAKWIYKKINDPAPLEDAADGDQRYIDKTRYERLKTARTAVDNKTPEEWLLKDDKYPTHEATFGESARRLRIEVEKLEGTTYPQKLRVLGMISRIEHLFRTLHQKKATIARKAMEKGKEIIGGYAGYRADGFEAMFFNDLALWLSIELPRLPIHETQSNVTVKRWMDYCTYVRRHVLIPRGDDGDANSPIKILDDILLDLKGLHLDMCKANKAASFNTRIQSIDAAILAISKSVFDFLHYLLKDVPSDYDIQVRSILEQAEKRAKNDSIGIDTEIQKILGYVMGQWILETFNLAGIRDNSFSNSKAINPDLIHLYFCDDFSKMSLDKTGLWQFAGKNDQNRSDRDSKNRAFSYLKQIIEIHRSLLMLYYVHESIVLGAMVSKNLGDAWVYGEDTGKGIITVLCKAIDNSCCKLEQTITNFWLAFYRDHYTSYARANRNNNNLNHCYRNLAAVDTLVEQLTTQAFPSIKQQLQQIQVEINAYTREATDIPNKVRALQEHLYTYVRITQMPLDDELRQEIERSANSGDHALIVQVRQYVALGDQLVSQEQTVIEYTRGTVPYYERADEILNGRISSSPRQLMREPASETFHSPIQRTIYREYLKPNNTVATLGWARYLSGVLGIAPWKIDPFIDTYSRIQIVLEMMYGIGDTSFNEPPTPVEIVLIDTLINEKIRADFSDKGYYSFNSLLPSPPLKVSNNGDKVELRFTGQWFEAIKNSLLHVMIQEMMEQWRRETQEFVRQLHEKEDEIAGLKSERDTLRAELDAIKDIINSLLAQKNLTELTTLSIEERLSALTRTIDSSEEEINHLRKNVVADLAQQSPERLSETDNVVPPRKSSFSMSSIKGNISATFMAPKSNTIESKYQKFDLILITLPSGSTIPTTRLGDANFLIQQDGRYYLYGRIASNQWQLIELDRKVVQALALPFPFVGQEVDLPYHRDNKPLFKHIHAMGIHLSDVPHVEKSHAFA